MNIVVKAPHMQVTDSIRQHVEEKANKLPKFYDRVHAVEVTLDTEGSQNVAEIIVTGGHRGTFIATHRDDDMYACIDQCLHKITEQLRRHKEKVRDHTGPQHLQIPE